MSKLTKGLNIPHIYIVQDFYRQDNVSSTFQFYGEKFVAACPDIFNSLSRSHLGFYRDVSTGIQGVHERINSRSPLQKNIRKEGWYGTHRSSRNFDECANYNYIRETYGTTRPSIKILFLQERLIKMLLSAGL